MSIQLKISDSGDSALFCSLGEQISPLINREVFALEKYIKSRSIDGIIEFVPSYTGLMVYYNPIQLDRSTLLKAIMGFEQNDKSESKETDEYILTIPVSYGADFGPDLSFVAESNGLSIKEVINIHCSVDYRTYMIGFTPGFPYLGGMDKRIATPRRAEPRLKIHAGSVGIAGEQTGIYPIDSPGGWQIIGKTPIRLFDPRLKNPFISEPGLYLRFREIDREEYLQIESMVTDRNYRPEIEKKQE